MNTDETLFPQQEAPIKNTDNAFVQVGKDGHPVIPKTADEKKEVEEQKTESASERR